VLRTELGPGKVWPSALLPAARGVRDRCLALRDLPQCGLSGLANLTDDRPFDHRQRIFKVCKRAALRVLQAGIKPGLKCNLVVDVAVMGWMLFAVVSVLFEKRQEVASALEPLPTNTKVPKLVMEACLNFVPTINNHQDDELVVISSLQLGQACKQAILTSGANLDWATTSRLDEVDQLTRRWNRGVGCD
jgi:hypothetical protein